MAWPIRSLLDYVEQLVPMVETFQTVCETEEKRKKTMESSVDMDLTYVMEQENELASILFCDSINKLKTSFRLISNHYTEKLKGLLTLFSKNHDDIDLISLRNRIDCNKYHNLQD